MFNSIKECLIVYTCIKNFLLPQLLLSYALPFLNKESAYTCTLAILPSMHL